MLKEMCFVELEEILIILVYVVFALPETDTV